MRTVSLILAIITGIVSFLVVYVAVVVFSAIITMLGFFLSILALAAS